MAVYAREDAALDFIKKDLVSHDAFVKSLAQPDIDREIQASGEPPPLKESTQNGEFFPPV